MRIGLVGVGRIGAFHAATLKSLPAVDQVVVADADPDRAEVVAKELGVDAAADVPALLASGVDGFVIAAVNCSASWWYSGTGLLRSSWIGSVAVMGGSYTLMG